MDLTRRAVHLPGRNMKCYTIKQLGGPLSVVGLHRRKKPDDLARTSVVGGTFFVCADAGEKGDCVVKDIFGMVRLYPIQHCLRLVRSKHLDQGRMTGHSRLRNSTSYFGVAPAAGWGAAPTEELTYSIHIVIFCA